MRIGIYSRKSIETDTGESVKNQIKLCKEYFERQFNDCRFEIFEDEGFSGGNINRPSFQRMMELVKINQFDIVAAYKIDRIARNIVDFVNVYDELEKYDVKLVSITEGFDPSTPVGKMMMLLLASFAEMERMNIAQRVKDNMKELAKMGRWSGGTPPTGYVTKKVLEGGKRVTYLELLMEESNYVIEIFKMYSSGYSTYKISQYFKNKGLNFPNKTILNMLSNPTYLISSHESVKYLQSQGYKVYGQPNGCGFLPYNRRPHTKNKRLWDSIDKFVGVSNHIAIIDLELWIKVQEMLKKKAIDPRPRESEFSYLSGLIKCRCGHSMFVQPGRLRKDGSRVYYFRCFNKECNNKFLRVDKAEKVTLSFMTQLLDKEHLQQYFKQDRNNITIENDIKAISKKITTNDKSINNLVDKLMLLSNEASSVITKRIEELSQQNNSLKEELLRLEREKLLTSIEDTNIDAAYTQVKNFIMCGNDITLRRKHLKTIVDYFIWDSDKEDELPMKLLDFK